MCGIVGVITADPMRTQNERENFFRQAIHMDTLRGEDSTGMFFVDHKNNVDLRKYVVSGPDFIQMKAVNKVLNRLHNIPILVGHNRYKTSGDLTVEDAHPHQEGPITLVHNGTITNTYQLPGYSYDASTSQVDSYKVAKALSNKPAMEVLPLLEGSYTLVWYDSRVQRLFIARNSERPLAWAWTEDKRTMYFMSEWAMLKAIGDRMRLKFNNNGQIYKPKDFLLFSFGIDKDGIVVDTEEYKEAERPVVSHMPFPNRYRGESNSYSYGYGPYDRSDIDDEFTDWKRIVDKEDEKGATPAATATPKTSEMAEVVNNINSASTKTGSIAQDTNASQVSKHNAVIVPVSSKSDPKERYARAAGKLAQFGLHVGELIWCLPVAWTPFKHGGPLGVGGFSWPKKKRIARVYNLSEGEWKRLNESHLFISLRATGVATEPDHLLADIDYKNLNKSWDYIASLDDKDDEISFIPMNENGKISYLSMKAWGEKTKHGCGLCQKDIPLYDYDAITWEDGVPLCDSCSEDWKKGGKNAKAN